MRVVIDDIEPMPVEKIKAELERTKRQSDYYLTVLKLIQSAAHEATDKDGEDTL